MSLNKLNCASAFSVNGPSHGRINGFVQDQNEPRANGWVRLLVQPQGSKPTKKQILALAGWIVFLVVQNLVDVLRAAPLKLVDCKHTLLRLSRPRI